MILDEKINCYRTGALNPEETQIALGCFDSFMAGFEELYEKSEPQDSTMKKIFRDLAADYTFEFFR